MRPIDYEVLGGFFVAMVVIGFVSVRKIKGPKDFFVGGGRVPWWLAGVSLHVSGYSGVIFVAMAGVAYRYGFTLYIWWALPSVLAAAVGVYAFAWRWAVLRLQLNIESPTEYLAVRYGVATQQLIAWCGVTLKLFDVGAKWAALGILLHGFTGMPFAAAVLISGGISLLYVTVGGLWADLYTDFAQFLVQLVAGLVLFVTVVRRLGGAGSIFGLWARLPAGHARPFNGPYTPWFVAGYILVSTLSGNGGTWNQAIRFIAAPTGKSAIRSAWLSGALYLIWPLILFFPMWAGPLLVPKLSDPTQLYPILALKFLPPGLLGLSLAAMFAATMSMTTSDTNAISAVITRDILPRLSGRFRQLDPRRRLQFARWSTLGFTGLTLVVGLEVSHFGGVIGLVVAWYGALVGPIAIPMLCGLLPAFKHADSTAAVLSILAGLAAFVLAACLQANVTWRVSAPILSSAAAFASMAWARRNSPVPDRVASLMGALRRGAGLPESVNTL